MSLVTSEDFGVQVCKTLGVSPDAVTSVVIEALPEQVLIITLQVVADDPEILEWARSEKLKNPTRIVLVGIDNKGEMT